MTIVWFAFAAVYAGASTAYFLALDANPTPKMRGVAAITVGLLYFLFVYRVGSALYRRCWARFIECVVPEKRAEAHSFLLLHVSRLQKPLPTLLIALTAFSIGAVHYYTAYTNLAPDFISNSARAISSEWFRDGELNLNYPFLLATGLIVALVIATAARFVIENTLVLSRMKRFDLLDSMHLAQRLFDAFVSTGFFLTTFGSFGMVSAMFVGGFNFTGVALMLILVCLSVVLFAVAMPIFLLGFEIERIRQNRRSSIIAIINKTVSSGGSTRTDPNYYVMDHVLRADAEYNFLKRSIFSTLVLFVNFALPVLAYLWDAGMLPPVFPLAA